MYSIGTKNKICSLVYSCYNCKLENKPTIFHNKIEVDNHWYSEHVLSTAMSAQFYATERASCYRCDEVGTFDQLFDHHSRMHTDELFVIVRTTDKTKCALCSYGGKFMNIHFKATHSNQTDFNPIRISVESLRELHVADNTNTMEKFICCQQIIELIDLIDHVQHAHVQHSCSKCGKYKTKDLVHMLLHLRDHGDCEIEPYLAEFKKSLQTQFYGTELLFSDGLVLFNYNLIGTKYDVIHDFNFCVDAWINKLKMVYHQENEKR